MTPAFRCLHDQLLVKTEPNDEKAGTIWIPPSARRPGATGGDKFLRFGTVLVAGPGDALPDGKRRPMSVKVGDRILYDHPRTAEIKVDGEDYVVLHEEQHVLAVVE
jgi:chaperonin GroES